MTALRREQVLGESRLGGQNHDKAVKPNPCAFADGPNGTGRPARRTNSDHGPYGGKKYSLWYIRKYEYMDIG